jgi:hypothetical protein
MAPQYANAYPRKRLFVEMFTRDVTLVDCILDLIDNAIDGLVRTSDLDLLAGLLREPTGPPRPASLPSIRVTYSRSGFSITDNCGGIPLKEAQDEAFGFGHSPNAVPEKARLGVYGIGLKRALFKMGRGFEVTSHTQQDGFRAYLSNIDEWLQTDGPDDWRIPLEAVAPRAPAGTTVKVRPLREEVGHVFEQAAFGTRLHDQVQRAYALFLDKHVRVILNGKAVAPWDALPGLSDEVTPARLLFEDHGVWVMLLAGIAPRDARGQWPAGPAGWYVACNGRFVVVADKTQLTGWGPPGAMPSFHDGKHRGFRGIALFAAADPLRLPWTTSKRGLHEESPIYELARNKMREVARPVVDFLDRMYPSAPQEAASQRKIADRVRPTGLQALMVDADRPFAATRVPTAHDTTVSVQYRAEKADLERVRTHLRNPKMAAREIGKFTLEHYLKEEGLR